MEWCCPGLSQGIARARAHHQVLVHTAVPESTSQREVTVFFLKAARET